MSLSKSIISTLKAVITLGGSLRYTKAALQYDEIYLRYRETFEDIAPLNSRLEVASLRLEDCIVSLKLFMKDHNELLGFNFYVPSISGVSKDPVQVLETINTQHNLMANTVSSGALSLAALSGAWLSVGTFGSASTGVAISGLSGIAASNATLAWFGFGSLASGGFGMAGGQIILTVVGTVITWFVTALTAHRKGRRLEKQNTTVLTEIERLREQLPELRHEVHKLERLCKKVSDLTSEYLLFARSCEIEIYPCGRFSKMKQKMLRLLGIRPYSRKQQNAVSRLQYETREILNNLSTL